MGSGSGGWCGVGFPVENEGKVVWRVGCGDSQRNRQVNAHVFVKLPFSKLPFSKFSFFQVQKIVVSSVTACVPIPPLATLL